MSSAGAVTATIRISSASSVSRGTSSIAPGWDWVCTIEARFSSKRFSFDVAVDVRGSAAGPLLAAGPGYGGGLEEGRDRMHRRSPCQCGKLEALWLLRHRGGNRR